MTMWRFSIITITSLIAFGAISAEPTGQSAMTFFEALFSPSQVPNCSSTDDGGIYEGIAKNCDLKVSDDGKVIISAKEVRGRVVSLNVTGWVAIPENLTTTEEAIEAVLFFHRANSEGRDAIDRVNLQEARSMRVELLKAIEYKPYTERAFAGASVQASAHNGTIRVTIFR